ncbi:MAG TPA: hypothetical protein VE553_08430, partial [Candidatus Binatia bacterium]|nr:hypothetical protein [Candidatus Binatia bacterium]
MSTERDRILKMVEDGAINATEAAELLAAVEDEAESPESSDRLPNVAHGDPPWEVPLVAGLVLSAFGLLGLLSGRRAGVLARVGALVTVFAGLAAALVGFWSRNAPWLHINVQERDGNN